MVNTPITLFSMVGQWVDQWLSLGFYSLFRVRQQRFVYLTLLVALPLATPSISQSAEKHLLFKRFGSSGPIKVSPYPLVRGQRVTTQGKVPFVKDRGKWTVQSDLYRNTLKADCLPERLEADLIQAGTNTYRWSQAAKSFFRRCEIPLTLGAPSKNIALLKMESLRYQIQLHPDIREVEFKLSQNTKVTGFLALKNSIRPRPLVIIKCGLFCDSQPSSGFKMMTMHLFDESPFHLLIVENMTSPSFIETNGRVGVGGLEEGRQIIEMAQMLQNSSPIRGQITEVHTVSPSLGGHAALYASLYNTYHPLNDGRPAIASSMALCPVVNLENSFADLFTGIKRDIIFTRMIRSLFSKIFPYVEALKERYDPKGNLSEEETEHILTQANLEHYQGLSSRDYWYPLNKPISTAADLWLQNDFVLQSQWVSKTPTLLVAADDDWVVRPSRNTDLFDRSGESGPRSSVNSLHLASGSHCVFSVSYGWEHFGKLVRSYILTHSPQFRQSGRWIEVPIRSRPKYLNTGERHMAQLWQLSVGSDQAQLHFKIWKGTMDSAFGGNNCSQGSRFDSGKTCFRQETLRISLRDFGGQFHAPRNEVEAQAMTRALNAQWRVVNLRGELLHDSIDEPAYVRGRSYL